MQNVPEIVRRRLKAAAPSADHPDANALTAFAERSLGQDERALVLEHLGRCNDCRDIVALALPAMEPVETAWRPAATGWLTWPALRWGFAAAGIVSISALGVVEYQRRPATTASPARARVEVAGNESSQAESIVGACLFCDDQEGRQHPSARALCSDRRCWRYRCDPQREEEYASGYTTPSTGSSAAGWKSSRYGGGRGLDLWPTDAESMAATERSAKSGCSGSAIFGLRQAAGGRQSIRKYASAGGSRDRCGRESIVPTRHTGADSGPKPDRHASSHSVAAIGRGLCYGSGRQS
jgi:hypothetical protein